MGLKRLIYKFRTWNLTFELRNKSNGPCSHCCTGTCTCTRVHVYGVPQANSNSSKLKCMTMKIHTCTCINDKIKAGRQCCRNSLDLLDNRTFFIHVRQKILQCRTKCPTENRKKFHLMDEKKRNTSDHKGQQLLGLKPFDVFSLFL